MILTKNVRLDRLRIKWRTHQKKLSDHKLIDISILEDELREGIKVERRVKSKQHEIWASRMMLG